MPEERWTSAMRESWYYALSAVEREMSGATGLLDYRTGGGAIRTSDWYTVYHNAERAYEQGGYPGMAGWDIPLPAAAHEVVDIDYEKEYVAVFEATYQYRVTGEYYTKMITVESRETLSVKEWEELALEVMESEEYAAVPGSVSLGRSWYYSPYWSK